MRIFERRRTRRGVALLEAIIALAILSTVAAAVLGLAIESTHAVDRAATAEREAVLADAFMMKVSLWTREDLDRHLGDRSEGPWRLVVLRPAPTLYVLALRDAASGAPLLSTSLYRSDPVHVAP